MRGNLAATIKQQQPGREIAVEDAERKTTLVSVDSIITANSLYANYSPNK